MADSDGSKEPEVSPVASSRPRRIRPRRSVFERLAQANCRWRLGDRVLVRDKDDSELTKSVCMGRPLDVDWKPGTVVSVAPLKVRLKGGQEAYSWASIKARSSSQSSLPRAAPASVEVLKRARKLSQRRRKREEESRQKDEEMEAAKLRMAKSRSSEIPAAAEQLGLEKARKLRAALEELKAVENQAASSLRASKGSKSPKKRGPSQSALKLLSLRRGLEGYGFQLIDLFMLTVKERKEVLKQLLHPCPAEAVQEEAFVEWTESQMQNLRMHLCNRLPEAAACKTSTSEELDLVRRCIDAAAAHEDDRESLYRLARIFKQANMGIEQLGLLPQVEFKQLAAKLNVKMTGLSKEDVVEMWKKRLWSRRAKATTVTVPQLCTYPPAEVISNVRRLLKKAEDECEKPMTAWQLEQFFADHGASVQDLGCLWPMELIRLSSWLAMPPLRSKDDIISWLSKELWRQRALRHAPIKSEPEIDEEESEESSLLELDGEFTMKYDMFIPS